MDILTGGLALLNLLGVFGNIWLLRRAARARPRDDPTAGQIDQLRQELEVGVTERAVQLYRDFRTEFEQTTARLKAQVAELEAQRDEAQQANVTLLAQVAELEAQVRAAREKEQQYQRICQRLDGEVMALRTEVGALRGRNAELEQAVRALQQEMDFYREMLRR